MSGRRQTFVYVRTSFTGFHRWKDAPDSVAFLKAWHRHVFGVEVGVPVSHGEREVEFFTLKAEVDGYLKSHYEGRQFESSCETVAFDLLAHFGAEWVKVDEDGENGAVVRSV